VITLSKVIRRAGVKEFVLLLLGALIYSVGASSFVAHSNIAPGGAVGIALMANYMTGFPVGWLTLLVNMPLLILSWFYLSHRFAVKTAASCMVCSFILDYVITPNVPVYIGDRLLGSLYGGILIGIGMAFIFMAGCTTGGSDIAGYLLQKHRPDVSIGKALLILDSIILTFSIFVFHDVDAGLFGLVSLYAQTKVIDAIIYGFDAGTKASIITRHPEEISQKIIEIMDRSATILSGKGAFSGQDTAILLCTVRKSEFSLLKQIIQETDKNAFVIVSETTEVFGLGFKSFKEAVQ
jgi:uncharacterized membrane-anchored protein YitT (DUF2179 family)